MADACIAVAGAPHRGLCYSWVVIGDDVDDALSLNEVGVDNAVAKSQRQSVVMQARVYHMAFTKAHNICAGGVAKPVREGCFIK